jgi:hypothetical protein
MSRLAPPSEIKRRRKMRATRPANNGKPIPPGRRLHSCWRVKVGEAATNQMPLAEVIFLPMRYGSGYGLQNQLITRQPSVALPNTTMWLSSSTRSHWTSATVSLAGFQTKIPFWNVRRTTADFSPSPFTLNLCASAHLLMADLASSTPNMKAMQNNSIATATKKTASRRASHGRKLATRRAWR